MSKCRTKNRESDELCFCPGKDVSVRQVLGQKFINGWVGEGLTRAANALAADDAASEERLWRMVATLEDEANGAYEMWKQTC